MKRLLIATLVLALLAPAVGARKKKKKAGEITDGVFLDAKHNFSLKLTEGWRAKVENDKSSYRLYLSQKQFQVPTDYMNAKDYTKVPRIAILVEESELSAFALLDSLLSETYKSDLKKTILKECEMLQGASSGEGKTIEEAVARDRRPVTIGGLKGIRWTAKANYRCEVATSASSMGGKRVNSAYGGDVIILQNGNQIMLFHLICEWPFHKAIAAEAYEMFNSLVWEKASK